MPRWNPRVDSNQKEIVTKLRQCGVDVLHLHGVGKNAPDIATAYRGITILLELKSVKGQHKAREAAQKSWCENWQGPAFVVRSFEEAWAVIQKTCRDGA